MAPTIFLRYNYGLLCVHETGGNWVPGGEGRRTVSGPGGSSTKAFPSGAQDHLVAIGFMDTPHYAGVQTFARMIGRSAPATF